VIATLAADGLVLGRHVTCAWWPPEAQAAFAEALAATSVADRPTAVVAMNDRVAMGVYQAAADQRLRIPRDLSVVSFDNSELSWWLSPGLTSIGVPYYELGRRSVEVLLGVVTAEIVERVAMPRHQRNSVAPPRRRRG
jgi:LacI family transcriptional regulator